MDLGTMVLDVLSSVEALLRRVPGLLMLGLALLPVLVSFGSRSPPLVVGVLLLSAASVAIVLSQPADRRVLWAGVAGLLSSLAIAAHGIREHRRNVKMMNLSEEIAHMRSQINVFLEALDHRTHELDKRQRTLSEPSKAAAKPPTAANPLNR